MNAYDELAARHKAHIYTKGINKGDAPLAQRGKSHFRIVKYDTAYAVRFHNTDILTVTPEGNITIDCEGYAARPTTVSAVNEALGVVMRGHPWLTRRNIFSHSQNVLRRYAYGKGETSYAYYDGVQLNSEGRIISPLRNLMRKRIDKSQVAEFMQGVESSGFKDVFKVIHAGMNEGNYTSLPYHTPLATLVSDNEYSEYWAQIIHNYGFETTRFWGGGTINRKTEKRAPSQTWAAIMKECKRGMYEVVDAGVSEA